MKQPFKTDYLLHCCGADYHWSFSPSVNVALEKLEHIKRYVMEGSPAFSVDVFNATLRCSWTSDMVARIRVDFDVERLSDQISKLKILDTDGIDFVEKTTYRAKLEYNIQWSQLMAAAHLYLEISCEDLAYWLAAEPGVVYAA